MLAPFLRSHHSLPQLALQRYALLVRSFRELAHSLHTLPCGAVEIYEYVFMLCSSLTGMTAIIASTTETHQK